jgi:vanillate O-demethylase monooxygenase subunit
MFLRDYWYAAALSSELGDQLLSREILGERIVLYRTSAGKPAALLDMCPHRQYPLSRGSRAGDSIRCGYHGLVFDAHGKCVEIPGQAGIPPRARVKSYPVVEKWRWIWIWTGDPALADEANIPDMHSNDAPSWTPTGGHLQINCHYQLLVDNLLDLSHAAYVHPSTIGDRAVAETAPVVRTEGNKIVLDRQMYDVNAPPFFRTLHGFGEKMDRMHRIEFTPPANIVILVCSVPVGTNDFSSPRAMRYYVLNGITPANERSVHHFWAVNRDFLLDDEKLTRGFQEQSQRTFQEDVEVLEAQQQSIELAGGSKWLDVNNDAAGVAARRLVASLLAQAA